LSYSKFTSNKMKIQLKIIGYLIYHAEFSEKELEISGPITAGKLLSMINIKKQLPRIILRNGKGIGSREELEDGDRIVISPLFSGG